MNMFGRYRLSSQDFDELIDAYNIYEWEGRLFEHIIMMILGYDITSIGLESTVKRHQQTVGVKDNVHYCLYGVRMC